jgi:hypothetical protein
VAPNDRPPRNDLGFEIYVFKWYDHLVSIVEFCNISGLMTPRVWSYSEIFQSQ